METHNVDSNQTNDHNALLAYSWEFDEAPDRGGENHVAERERNCCAPKPANIYQLSRRLLVDVRPRTFSQQ